MSHKNGLHNKELCDVSHPNFPIFTKKFGIFTNGFSGVYMQLVKLL